MSKLRAALGRLLRVPFFPVLFGWWFLLVTFTANINQLEARVLVVPLLVVGLVIALFWGLAWLLTRGTARSAILATLGVFAFFGYGHLLRVVSWVSPAASSKGSVIASIVLLVCLLLAGLVAFGRRNWAKGVPHLNFVAGVLVLMNLVAIGGSYINQPRISGDRAAEEVAVGETAEKPDIYYIVPDRYASNTTWQEFFNYDNTGFEQSLEERGFKVYDDAHSNYPYTTQSLASTLNMRYLEPEAKELQGQTEELLPLYNLIGENAAVKNLKAVGYRYVHIGSWWWPTSHSALADVSFNKAIAFTLFNQRFAAAEYTQLILRNSMGQILLRRGISVGNFTVLAANVVDSDVHANAFTYQLDSLQKTVTMPGPKIVFVHLLMPHPPFVFNADGSRLKPDSDASKAQLYVEQLKFTNRKLVEMIDQIQARSKTKPVILLQADEGPYPGEGIPQASGADKMQDYTPADLQTKFGILRALSLPHLEPADIPEELSSVNLFRFVFNKYLGTNLELLPEKQLVFPNASDPYNFIDRTDAVKGYGGPGEGG
ncbi:hypothetical protein KY386_00260 [Candidatus Parcubacteria bacterium]|nr:hypothetical protein [Candidatus Parcubacteria bacterium]